MQNLVRFVRAEQRVHQNHSTHGGSGQAKRVKTTPKQDGRSENGREKTQREQRTSHRTEQTAKKEKLERQAKERRDNQVIYAQELFEPDMYIEWYDTTGYKLSGTEFKRQKGFVVRGMGAEERWANQVKRCREQISLISTALADKTNALIKVFLDSGDLSFENSAELIDTLGESLGLSEEEIRELLIELVRRLEP